MVAWSLVPAQTTRAFGTQRSCLAVGGFVTPAETRSSCRTWVQWYHRAMGAIIQRVNATTTKPSLNRSMATRIFIGDRSKILESKPGATTPKARIQQAGFSQPSGTLGG